MHSRGDILQIARTAGRVLIYEVAAGFSPAFVALKGDATIEIGHHGTAGHVLICSVAPVPPCGTLARRVIKAARAAWIGLYWSLRGSPYEFNALQSV